MTNDWLKNGQTSLSVSLKRSCRRSNSLGGRRRPLSHELTRLFIKKGQKTWINTPTFFIKIKLMFNYWASSRNCSLLEWCEDLRCEFCERAVAPPLAVEMASQSETVSSQGKVEQPIKSREKSAVIATIFAHLRKMATLPRDTIDFLLTIYCLFDYEGFDLLLKKS